MRGLLIDRGGKLENLIFNNKKIIWPWGHESIQVPLILGDIIDLKNNNYKQINIVNIEELIIKNETSVSGINYGGMLKRIIIESGLLNLTNYDYSLKTIEIVIKKNNVFTLEKNSTLNIMLRMDEGACFSFYDGDQHYKITSPCNNFIIDDVNDLLSYANLINEKFIFSDNPQFPFTEAEEFSKYINMDEKVIKEFMKQNFNSIAFEPKFTNNYSLLPISNSSKESDIESQSDLFCLGINSNSFSDSDSELLN